MTEITSISVTKDVRERVKRFADFKDETYSAILNRIMDDSEELVRRNADTSIGYYSEDEMCDLVHDPEIFREYVYGLDDAVVHTAYKKSYVDKFINR